MLQNSDFYQMWRCPNLDHFRCYSARHIKFKEVVLEGQLCALDCECWRHRIVALADRVEPFPDNTPLVNPKTGLDQWGTYHGISLRQAIMNMKEE